MTIRTNALRGGVWLFGAVTLIGAIPAVASAQGAGAPSPPVVTTADYARAETMLAAVVNRLVVGGTVNATWLADDRFTYRATTADGFEFLMVDPVKRSRTRAFDHERLGAALAMASGAKVDAKRLPFRRSSSRPTARPCRSASTESVTRAMPGVPNATSTRQETPTP